MRSVRVLIVEDQAPFRAAAAAVIDLTEPFVLAGAVASGEESLARLQDLVPDLVLMDINLPGMDGIEAAALIAARPQPPIVVLDVDPLTSGIRGPDRGLRRTGLSGQVRVRA